MSDKQIYILAHDTARQRAIDAVRAAPAGCRVEIREGRTGDQNAIFHALCTEVAKSGAQWAGKRRTAVQWKGLFVSGHSIATGLGAEMVPGLEGEYLNLRESTASMSKKRASSLIDYTIAWCATHGIEIAGGQPAR